MQHVLEFLKDNGSWIFGTGGLAALIVGGFKLVQRKQVKGSAQVIGSHVGGDVVGRDKISSNTQKKSGLIEIVLGFILVAAGGFLFWGTKTLPVPASPSQVISSPSKVPTTTKGHK